MVPPVTVDEAVSLKGFGCAGVVTVRVAVLVTGVDPVTVADRLNICWRGF